MALGQLRLDPTIPDAQLQPFKALLGGVICLLPKPNQAQDEVAKHRPITLLGCDVKLVLMVMADRLQLPLDYLVDVTQSAYVLGRDISDNVRLHLGLRARLAELGLPAWLQLSDIRKAYDRVVRSFLVATKLRMGFKADGHVLWGRLLLNGSSAKVRVNGHLSGSFPVDSNIPQGSHLSCMDWVITFQALFSYLNSLQHSGRISSFLLPSGRVAPAVAAYADDVSTVILDHTQLETVIKPAFLTLAAAGAAEQSVDKTEHLHLGGAVPPAMDATQHLTHLPTGYKLLPSESEATLRHLGVPMASSLHQRLSEAYGNMPGKILGSGLRWQPLMLTRYGRSHVANQCLLSKTVFQSNFHKPSAAQSSLIQRAVNQFVARSQRPEERTPNSSCLYPKAAVCHLPASCGGLGLLDIEAQVPSLLAKPCWKLFDYSTHPWHDLFGHEVSLVTSRVRQPQPTSAATPPLDSAIAAGIPPGHHWIVTCPAAGRHLIDTIVSPSTQASVDAFLSLGLTRIISPATMDPQSILLELTFHNASICTSHHRLPVQAPATHVQDQASFAQAQASFHLPVNQAAAAHVQATSSSAQAQVQAQDPALHLSPSMMLSARARTWLRLRDIRDAFNVRDTLAPLETQDLQFILQALPAPWRDTVCAPQDPLPPWRVVSDPGAALTILEGPDPMFIDQDSPAHDQAPARDQAPRPSPPMLRWLLIPASGQLVR